MKISFILPQKTPTKHDITPMSKILSELSKEGFDISINKVDKEITHYFTWNVGKDLYYDAKDKFPNAKFINLIWDIPQWRIDGKDDYGKNFNWDSYYKPFIEKADILLSASEFTQKTIQKNYGIESKVFYMFFDNQSLNKKSLYDFLAMFKKKDNKKFKIIGISRLVPSKKFEILINAISILKKVNNYNNISLTLIGSGPEKSNLKKIAKIKEVPTKFYENISRSKLIYILKSSNLLVAPSVLEGDCGWAPCEAIFSDIPVIVSDIEVTKEFLKDSVIYFKKNDSDDLSLKIKNFIENKSDYKKMLDNAKKNLNFYTMNSFKLRLSSLLNEI
tara:strand:- start:1193 stop:2188 length:996 start_codon:yes stop_codon:yes gene_type:complete